MNFKKTFSVFLLFTILISSFSFPLSTQAEECEVISADFLEKPKGPVWYKEGKIIQMQVRINDSSACNDKKIQFQIQAKTGKSSTSISGYSNLENFKEATDVVFPPGENVLHSPFIISEEKCYDLDQNDIEEEIASDWFGGLATNIDTLLAKLEMSHDQFIDKMYPVLKNDEIGFSTLEVDGAPFYDRQTLTRDDVQGVLNNVDSIDYPKSEWQQKLQGFGKFIGLNAAFVSTGLISDINDFQRTDLFQDQVAKQLFYEAGIYDCNYTIQTRIGMDDQWKDQGGISYMCDFGITAIGNECNDGDWKQKSGFTPGIRPTVVTDSLCLNKDGNGYDEDCYEPLAPIPGFGRKLNFSDNASEDGTQPFTLGTYIGTIIKIAIGAASVAAVIFLIYAGLQYMVAGKSGGGALLDKARKRIYSIGWGILVLLGSWILLNTINPELLKINPKFEKITLEAPEAGDSGAAPSTDDSNKTAPSGPSGTCSEGIVSVQTSGGKFFACKTIANNLKAMIDKAHSENIKLSGGGYRTKEEQIQLRKDKCHGDYTSKKPSPPCKPKVALPGQSRHESGKAFDLTCDKKLITVTTPYDGKYAPDTKKCFDWLKANASTYGLKNYPAENWHWSVDGH